MCGIASVISSDPARRAKVDSMLAVQFRRGPDHLAQVHDGVCAMAHNRLSLLDLSEAGDQPMQLGPATIVYNGEVYNHLELRRQYLGDVRFRGTSDTETLLHLFERLGVPGTLPLLRGMYAFAVWYADAQRLIMATDPFGIKPLYVWQGPGEFACASSSAALMNVVPKPRIDRAAMARFFHLGGADGVWQGVRRVNGGHILTYDHATQRTTERQWYQPTYRPDAAETIDHILTEAMDQVQLSDVPVGLFLSGGVDSSIAASRMPAGSKAFHLDSDERQHAATVAKRFGMELHVVEPDQSTILEAHADIARKTGEPTMAGHIPWLVSRTAAQHVKAAISANGADELFFGYPRTATEMSVPELDKMQRHMFRSPHSFTFSEPIRPPNMDILSDPSFPDCAITRWFELRHYIQHDLNPTLDAASMCHSLEMRVPFLDHHLVEAALSLPHTWHRNKALLRDRLKAAGVPAATVDHAKLGFSMKANDPMIKRRMDKAVLYMAKEHGLHISKEATGRDRSYLTTCCLAWRVWEGEWKTTMK
jgi:asparagine synthase (glutamine-hydrolysing)